MRVASLPMYDMPEIRGLLDDFWLGLGRNLKRQGVTGVPDIIIHRRPLHELWNDPRLWFSQCCGYDLVNRYARLLRPIGTPHFRTPECKGYEYTSIVVVHEDNEATDVLDMRGAVCVINGPESHSGTNALRALVAPASQEGRFFSQVKVSGAHALSLEMIKRGDADVGSIDCVTYTLLEHHRPAAVDGIRKLGTTYSAPGVPYVTRSTEDEDTVSRMREAILNTFDDPQLAMVRDELLLEAIEFVPISTYGQISRFQRLARRHGYSRMN